MKSRTVWPELSLERSLAASTLRQQIEKQLTAAIRAGTLPAGSRLPSSRLLAKLLNVSRGTVLAAYDALRETGVLVTTVGSGVTVAASLPGVPNFTSLRRTVIAAHYPARTCLFEDCDGNPLYLNVH